MIKPTKRDYLLAMKNANKNKQAIVLFKLADNTYYTLSFSAYVIKFGLDSLADYQEEDETNYEVTINDAELNNIIEKLLGLGVGIEILESKNQDNNVII